MRLRHAILRAATLPLALPLAAGFAAPAQAQTVEVPGCYGVAVIVCDPAIEIALPVGLQPFTTVIPVCAGTCTDVPVTAYTVTFPQNPQACLKTEDRNGNQDRTCVPLSLGSLPSYHLENCYYSDQSGYLVVDENGNTVADLCFTTGNLGSYYVEACGSGYVGAYVYDEWGNQVAGRCVRIPRIPTVGEACDDVNNVLALLTDIGELNCNISN